MSPINLTAPPFEIRSALLRSAEAIMTAAESTIAPILYRVDEAAEALRISRSVIYELIRSSQLRTVKVGRRRLVPVEALEEYVASLRGEIR